MAKSYFSSLLVLLFFVLIESSLLSNISFLPAFPDFVMICVLYFSVRNGKTAGEITGFAGGLMLDFVSGGPFGIGAVVRTLMGYAGGLFCNLINYKSFFVCAVTGVFATLTKAALILAVSLLFPRYVNRYHVFSSVFVLELILNAIFTPLVFKLLRSFDSFFAKPARYQA